MCIKFKRLLKKNIIIIKNLIYTNYFLTLFLIKFYLNLIEFSSNFVYKYSPLLFFNKFGIKNGKQKKNFKIKFFKNKFSFYQIARWIKVIFNSQKEKEEKVAKEEKQVIIKKLLNQNR